MTNEQRAKALTTDALYEALKMTNNEEIKRVILNELATRQEVNMKYVIVYNGEIIDYAENTKDACQLVKEYRMAFKSGNIWYKRGE